MKKFIPALLFVLSSFAFADNKVILVSDIDDTIKVSHVLDKDSTVANAFVQKNAFLGMPELYTSLLADKKVDEIVYLSNAPKLLMLPFHKRFLARTGFPEGKLLLSSGLSNKNHKVTSLRELIKKENPKELILVGDNGERDTLVYATIQKEFPAVKMTTYIHQAYSLAGFKGSIGKPLEVNQSGFATALDLSAELMNLDLLSESSYAALLSTIIPAALKEGNFGERGRPLMFPAWFDCRDFKVTELPVKKDVDEKSLNEFNKKLAERCSIEPFED